MATEEERIQYQQACQDFRDSSRLTWQAPALGIAVSGVIISVVLRKVTDDERISGQILVVVAIVLFALIIQAVKHNFYERTRAEFLAHVEAEWLKEGLIRSVVQRSPTGQVAAVREELKPRYEKKMGKVRVRRWDKLPAVPINVAVMVVIMLV